MPEQKRPDDIHLRGVAVGAAMIVSGIAFALGAAWWGRSMLTAAAGPAGPNAAPTMRVTPPVLEAAPQPALADYEARQRRLTDSYDWVDRQAGVARIPVEQAMRVLAARAAAEPRP
jgi:hypothetical protein